MPPEIEDRGRLEGMTGGLCCPCPSCVYKSCHRKKTSVEQWGVWGAQAALSRPEGAVGRPRVPLGEGLVWLKLPAGATRGRSWLLASLLGGGGGGQGELGPSSRGPAASFGAHPPCPGSPATCERGQWQGDTPLPAAVCHELSVTSTLTGSGITGVQSRLLSAGRDAWPYTKLLSHSEARPWPAPHSGPARVAL